MKKSLILTFCLLVVTFLAIVCELFCPAVRELFKGSLLFLLPIIVFFLLGMTLIFLTVRQRVKGMLKKFLLLTGASAAGFFISIFLHNVIYGLLIYLFGATKIGLSDEPFFFIIAIVVCPIGFIIGATGSAVLFINLHYSHS